MKGNMVQYAVLPNCTNNCKFCLCRDKRILSTDQIIKRINDIDENITYIDWKNKFYKGIFFKWNVEFACKRWNLTNYR